MFTTVLVANRGEIACRVIGTLRRLGIRSVAIHAGPAEGADAGSRHVREADVAVSLGGEAGARAYLDVEAVVAAAVATGAEAIHPGYGFLSENPELAHACERAGIAFVGPPAGAIEAMADKVAGKRIVAGRGVPVLPGTLDDGLDDDALVAAADDVGFPLLVKPVAGGGGKGMVVVSSADELPAALASARRVATSAFGDDGLLLERLVERPRHVEVQVLADARGSVVHLGERECTLQRRHQKIIEEAPSPVVDAATRDRLGAAACEVARSVGYVGVGTVEFLVPADAPDDFAFIEMNTRLQVEHPVTEMVTGLDLVEAQLRVAAGEPLWFTQDDVRITGQAIEARVYAESPARGFLPSVGRVDVFDDAGVGAGPEAFPLRLDAGVASGDEVSGDYDPMLAKAVAHGVDRDQALARLDGLLARTAVLGVETNVGFLRDLLADPDVRAGKLDTGLVDRFTTDLSEGGAGGQPPGPDSSWVVAALLDLGGPTTRSSGTADPWVADGWRLNAPRAPRPVALRDPAGDVHDLAVTGHRGDAVVVRDGGAPVRAGLRPAGGPAHRWLLTELSGRGAGMPRPGSDNWRAPESSGRGAGMPRPGSDSSRVETVAAVRVGDTVWVARAGRTTRFTVLDRAARAALRRSERATTGDPDAPAAGPTEIRAQMPGTVTATHAAGPVEAGAAVVVVEAMKMEHPLTAPAAGTLRLVVHPGDQVRLDQVVAVVEPEGAS
ncbi:acetyl-CoA/propionyl-CoA carboxylase, biotin carboxylase, biotin carboxyl carrier protein [Isoptericola sp. CG 20/1183]|uniref:biotin carboxylase n=1 Tax=Isoptericola halotolerans TaxID=300560 RepID=A0ABX5EJ28_9MICO|nr:MULTISPECIES: biotin carboxylase N-terminal domain-containing protein [Isoptericola]PRZ09614.1 acetyl-CoA/propionyl-CoA carboxylase, biotin carboxylase, biotin carboxyl carrier protein [Isoptericola sp. CG 20/1183]PRZ10415.1 acetyl-CoA/propionyl-CoA carboxylase, biotin carboxylase, biotin carboxyl carrier protein [Isoptericola halotolerans]